MSITRQTGPAIVVGYPYALTITTSSAVFGALDTYTSQVREAASDASALFTLTSADGDLTRVSDTELTLTMTDADTALCDGKETVVVDMVRTSETPEEHVMFILTIPVEQPVTRGL